MVTILGIQLADGGKSRYAPQTDAVLAYIKAVKEGKSQAKKILNSIVGKAVVKK